ncbi:MAG: hypothetical protein ABH845_05055 [Candidatus Omnitrophota bacterium]
MKKVMVWTLVLAWLCVGSPALAKDKGKGSEKAKPKKEAAETAKSKKIKGEELEAFVDEFLKEETTAEGSVATPPGLSEKEKTPLGLEKKDKTPAGWEKGEKKGWEKPKRVEETKRTRKKEKESGVGKIIQGAVQETKESSEKE